MNILILDDVKFRHDTYDHIYKEHEITHVYTYSECVKKLSERVWDLVHLDHDLGEFLPDASLADVYIDGWGKPQEYNGQHVALRIAEMEPERRPRFVIIHSVNGPGSRAMLSTLLRANVPATREPFSEPSDEKESVLG